MQAVKTRTPRRRSSTRPAFDVLEDRTVPSGLFGPEHASFNPHDWPMFNRDPAGTRHNSAESRLSPSSVGALQEMWRLPTDGALAGTPAVVNNVVYAADLTGTVYAVTHDGELLWRTTLNVPTFFSSKVGGSVLVTNRTLVVGDAAGQIHGLDIDDGAVRWTTRPGNGPLFPEGHPLQAIYGGGTMVGKYVAFGVSSWEWLAPALDPSYPGFTFRGNLVLIDPADGSIVWQTFFVDPPTLQPDGSFGPSGVTVWSSPAYDLASNTLFVGTGQNYNEPTTDMGDSLIALDAATGAIKWVSQKTAGDHWNFSFIPGPSEPADFDIGDSPQLYRLNGRLVVAAGQKSGFFHVVDAETGEEIATPQQYLPHGLLGGFHIDSAHADGVNYAPGNRWDFFGGPPEGGAVFALSGDGSHDLWSFDTDSPIISGVAVANGVVYFQELDGEFHAVDAATGLELAKVVTGSQMSGPAISRGQIYLGAGDVLSLFTNPVGPVGPGAIVALGIPDRSTGKPGGGDDHPTLVNTPPTFINRSVTSPIVEGDTATLSGTIVDPDPLDTFFLDVDWGDGIVKTFSFADANGETVNITHTYEDENDEDKYVIKLSWRDDHEFGNSGELAVVVHNVDPIVDAGGDVLLAPGGALNRNGSFADPGADTWTAIIDYGDGSGPQPLKLLPGGRFHLQHRYAQAGPYLVTVTVTDDDGGVGSATFTVETSAPTQFDPFAADLLFALFDEWNDL